VGEEPADRLIDAVTDAGRQPEALGPLAAALRAYHEGRLDAVMEVTSDLGRAPDLPMSLLFSGVADMSELDRLALDLCRGRVLYVGAAAGRHALVLQARGLTVTAIDVLPAAVEIMKSRGVSDPRLENVLTFTPDEPYDSVIALMNGTSILGSLSRLEGLLIHLTDVVAPGGQILIDSTDLRSPPLLETRRADGRYCGEVDYQLSYDGVSGPPLPQLFVDPVTFEDCARGAGWTFDLIARGEERSYLVRLER